MDLYKLPIFAESWNIAFRKKGEKKFLEDVTTPFALINNSFRFWAADPFVFEDGNDVYIFAELYDYIKRRGIIGYYRINDPESKWTPVISEDYHLSFPYIFKYNDQIYILPETSQNSSVHLYRAVKFPDKWEKNEVLLSGVKYADTTPFSSYGRRMAFSYDLSVPCLRVIDFTDGRNVVADSSSPELKRPAGKIDLLEHIRVAQNCKEDYGKGLIFYSFSLGEDLSYEEREYRRIFPEDLMLSRKIYLDGIHTYNSSEHYEVIDIKTRRFNVLNLLFRIVSKVKRKK